MNGKKKQRNFICPKKPELITDHDFKFFMLEGKGNPKAEEFAEAVGLLYSLSYAVKMLPKKNILPEGYSDFAVFPLEGIWDLED